LEDEDGGARVTTSEYWEQVLRWS